MSKSNNPAALANSGGGSRGDVSFIRAVQGSSGMNQGEDNFSGFGSSHNLSGSQGGSHQRLPHDIALQPHLYHMKPQKQHQHPHQSPLSTHSQNKLHHHHSPTTQPYLPDHMETQQYHFKHSHHGAGGASGEPGIRGGPSHTEGWSEREEALVTELEEAKIRVAQMEKTMRWWSDCTSNWREKWNKARGERNKAKDENRILRAKLETLAKEVTRLRRERKEAQAREKGAAPPSSEEQAESQEHLSPVSSQPLEEDDGIGGNEQNEIQSGLSEKEKIVIASTSEKECESLDELSEASSSVSKPPPKDGDEKCVDAKDIALPSAAEQSNAEFELTEKVAELEEELSQMKVKAANASENAVVMQRKLDEANNTIQVEKLEKCRHVELVEQLQSEVKRLKLNLEEEKDGKQELNMQRSSDSEFLLDEDAINKVKTQHQDELNRLTLDLEDEANSRSSMDKQVSELRRDLERIQAENASEWAKRERLESEKLALERDNKKLRAQVSDLEEELEKRSQATSSMVDSDLKTLQFELAESQKVDKQGNAARKAQRTNDELQAQVDSFQVQVNHLQTRLRSTNKLGSGSTTRSTSLKSLVLDDPADLGDSENDFDDI
ncbi:coiled-coil domain-containing protein 102A [Elysia marginata]|uniref:Coiled-coil domain-containing protein 102A n=1 Tax=Elysia marginata TaxID=1093978 RepID=A0AAV4I4V3_9GAST|nr:coiled-coil domain-containing protein 102A [Elysia marginata]